MTRLAVLCYIKNMKYLFLSPADENYLFYYSDLLSNKDVLWLHTSLNKKGVVGFFYRMHISKKLNKILNIPFKDIWICKYKTKNVKQFLEQEEDVLVIVFRHSFFLFYRHSYEKWLRKINPNVKMCFLFADIVESYNKGFDMNIAKEKFNELFTFDKEDSERHHLVYYPHIIPFPKRAFFKERFQLDKKMMGGDSVFYGKSKKKIAPSYQAIQTA